MKSDHCIEFIISFGNPLDGFEYIGTFYDYEEAQRYGEFHLKNLDWWIILLQRPSE